MLVDRPAKKRHSENVQEPVRGSREAYEDNWYRVLAGKAELGDRESPPDEAESARHGSAPSESASSEPTPSEPQESAAPSAARPIESQPVVELVPPAPASRRRATTRQPEAVSPLRLAAGPSSVRIGVRKLDDPEGTYLHYLTRSPHADFFRSDLWPATRELTPVHLWRANHIGARWDLERVVGFMQGPARRLEQLVASAPSASSPGSADRRVWIKRLLHSECVTEFGLDRITKTIHPILPNLVPDLDTEMMSWARAEWLGVRGDPDEADACVEVWEVLEDALVVRADVLDQVVRSVRGKAQRRAPTGRLGLVLAAFWESYWQEAGLPSSHKPVDEERDPSEKRERAPKDKGVPAKRTRVAAKPRASKGATTKVKASKAATPKVPAQEAPPVDKASKPRRSRRAGPTPAG
jgi:hypothetical protein